MAKFRVSGLVGLGLCVAFPAYAQYTTMSAPDPIQQGAIEEFVEEVAPVFQQPPTASFRPRPQQNTEDTSVDELPSFTVEPQNRPQPQTQPKAGVAGSAAVPEKPKRIPKGEIWVYSTDFELGEVGGYHFCSFKRVVQNKTDMPIDRLTFQIGWLKYVIPRVVYSGLGAGASDVSGMTIYSQDCPSMNVRPVIKILTCRVGDVIGAECNKLVVVK